MSAQTTGQIIDEIRRLDPWGGDRVRAQRYDWPEPIETVTYFHHYDEVLCLVTRELTNDDGTPRRPFDWVEFRIIKPRQEAP